MNAIKLIFSPLYTIWALIGFMGFVLLIMPVIWFLKAFRPLSADSDFYKFGAAYSRFWMYWMGIPYRIHNREAYYHKDKTYIVCSNHVSNLDIFCSSIPVYTPIRIFAKSEIKKMPFIGQAFSMVSVFVDRSSAESRRASFEKIRQELVQGGFSVLIYPEGTRNKTQFPLNNFYDGAFKLAIDAQVPLIFYVSIGTRNVLHPRSFLFKPGGKIDVYFLPPYETKGMTEKDLPELKARVHHDVWQFLTEKDPYFKNIKQYNPTK